MASAKSWKSTVASHRVFTAILLSGIMLRLWNIGWGLPHLYEEAIPLRFGMKLWPSLPPSIDFHFFVYPAFSYYLHLCAQFLHFCAGYVVGSFSSLGSFIASFETDPSGFTLVARSVTIVFDAGIIVMSYATLDRFYGRTSALIAAAMISFNVLHVREAHLVNVDTLLTFFSVATLYRFYRLSETPTFRSYTLCGIMIGLAAASKYNGSILVLALVVVHLLTAGSLRAAFRADRLVLLLAGGAIAGAVFLLFNPLIIPHYSEFIEKFRNTETHMEAGHLGLDAGRSTFAYYVFDSLPANLGIPISIAAFLASIGLAATRGKKHLLLMLTPALFLATLALWKMRADRYIFPAVSFLLMIAAVGISEFLETAARRFRPDRAAGARVSAALHPYLTTLLVLLLMIPSFRTIIEYQVSAGLPDTRTAAGEWINRHVKPGSAIATGPFGIELNPTQYILLPIQFTAVNSERMTPFYNPGWYEDIDLVVVSDFDYGRYLREPGRFREIIGYLDTIRSSWELVRAFEPGDSLSGPSIWLYRYPGNTADAAFSRDLISQLLTSELETERKISFLGKLGLILSVQGKLTRSEQLFRTLLTLDPGNERAGKAVREITGFRMHRRRTVDAANDGSTPPSTPAGEESMALIERGDSLLAAERFREAERIYREALRKDPYATDAYLGLTMVYASTNERGKVVGTLKELLSILTPGTDDYEMVLWQLRSMDPGDP